MVVKIIVVVNEIIFYYRNFPRIDTMRTFKIYQSVKKLLWYLRNVLHCIISIVVFLVLNVTAFYLDSLILSYSVEGRNAYKMYTYKNIILNIFRTMVGFNKCGYMLSIKCFLNKWWTKFDLTQKARFSSLAKRTPCFEALITFYYGFLWFFCKKHRALYWYNYSNPIKVEIYYQKRTLKKEKMYFLGQLWSVVQEFIRGVLERTWLFWKSKYGKSILLSGFTDGLFSVLRLAKPLFCRKKPSN